MGDPKWDKLFTHMFNRTVFFLSEDFASLLKSLLSNGLLDQNEYDEIRGAGAVSLLLGLAERPAPSFDKFLNVLEEYVKKKTGCLCKCLLEMLKESDVVQPKASSKADRGSFAAASDLERCPTDKELAELSRKVASKWKDLARLLNVPEGIIDEILSGSTFGVKVEAYRMLCRWKAENGQSASVARLRTSLYAKNLGGIAAELFDLPLAQIDTVQNSQEITEATKELPGTLRPSLGDSKDKKPLSAFALPCLPSSAKKKEVCVAFKDMKLKFKELNTLEETVGFEGAKIGSELLSLAVPQGAIDKKKPSARLGFTVYVFDEEGSKGVLEGTVVTDLLALHPCGEVFEKEVTVTLSHDGLVSPDTSVALLYEPQHEGSYNVTWAQFPNDSKVNVRGCPEMNAKFHPNIIEINTKHFCELFGVVFGCTGHTFRALAYEMSGKDKSRKIDIHFTSCKHAGYIESENNGRAKFAGQNVNLRFSRSNPYKLEVIKLSPGWAQTDKEALESPLDYKAMKRALKSREEYCTRLLKLEMIKDEAVKNPEISIRITGGKSNVNLLLGRIPEVSLAVPAPEETPAGSKKRQPADYNQQVMRKRIIAIKDKVVADEGQLLTFGIVLLKKDDMEVKGINSKNPHISIGDKFANICYHWLNTTVSAATTEKLCGALEVLEMDKKAKEIWAKM